MNKDESIIDENFNKIEDTIILPETPQSDKIVRNKFISKSDSSPCLISNELGCKIIDGSSIYNKIKNSVVMISVDNKWQGTGFFVNNEGYICTAAHVISTTADEEKETGPLIAAKNVYVLVSPNYHVYKCRVVGFDGAGDIGVIKIDENDPYNKNLPKIDNNEYLKFGNNVKTGNLAYVLGYPLGTDISSFSMGIIRNESFVAPSLFLPFNLVLVTTPAYQGNSGSAIVNTDGEVVGLLTFVYFSKEQTYESIGGGPSKDIVSFVVNSIINGDKGSDPHFDKTTKKFRKGFLGVGSSKMVWFSDLPVISNKYKFPEIRPIGFRGQVEKTTKSDFSKIIKQTDIITKINGIDIGALPDQKAPGSVLWKLLPGDTVKVDYYTLENEKYILKKDVELKLLTFPDELDTFEGRSLKVEINCSDQDCSLASGFTELPEPLHPIGF
jgi:S1-C subfamily serine protease